MFAYFYHVCLVIFLLQGISTPFLLVISGVLWWKQSQQLESLKKELEISRREKIKPDKIFELVLSKLPKLRPLNCINCGAGVLLQETQTFCPHCRSRGNLPEDYVAAVSLKWQVKNLFKSAVRHWRVANVITYPLVGWIFFLLIFIEPLVLFPTVLIGSNVFPDTWIDSAFSALGETTTFLIMLFAFFGFIIWMIVFIFLTTLSKNLRKKLPVIPVFEGELRGSETASCQACGGGIEYGAGDFVCICSYCNVENFRVRFVGSERAQAEKQKTQTKSVLFGAMEILEDFAGTFFFVSTILVGASILLTLFYAIKYLL
jgi:Zn finger protein HypA/HybF involved in hydrogenase expression